MRHINPLLALLLLAVQVQSQTAYKTTFDYEKWPDTWQQHSLAKDGGWQLFGKGQVNSSNAGFAPNSDWSYAYTSDISCACDKSEDILILPGAYIFEKGWALYFEYFFPGYTNSNSEELSVVLSYDQGKSWKAIASFKPTYSKDWSTAKVELGPVNAQVKTLVGIRYSDGGGQGYGAAIDNLAIFPTGTNALTVKGNWVSQYPVWADQRSQIDLEVHNLSDHPLQEVTPFVYLQEELQLLDPVQVDLAANGSCVITLSLEAGTKGIHEAYVGVTVDPDGLLASGLPDVRSGDFPEGTDLIPVDLVALSSSETELQVYVEQGTGTWCGWCPRGHVKMEELINKYDNVAPISIHYNDPMEIPVYSNYIANSIGGFPAGHVQRRFLGLNPLQFEDRYLEALTFAPHADLSMDISFDAATRDLEVTVIADMVAQCISCRLNLIITEDGLTGAGSTWAQANFYAGGGAGPMGGWESKPNPVPASQMVYNQVARLAVGSPSGVSNSLPIVAMKDKTYSYTFNLTLDEGWNPDNINLIALIHNGNTVSNARIAGMLSSSTQYLPENITRLELFPNPAVGEAYLRLDLEHPGQVTLQVVNMLGQPVYRQDFGQQQGDLMYRVPLDGWTPGLYRILIQVDGTLADRPLVIGSR